MDQFLLLPDALFPVDAAPLFDEPALVHSDGEILAVGPAAKLRPQFSGAAEIRLPNTALLPGLINAHCHLELSYLRGQLAPAHFVDWVMALMQNYPPPEEMAEITRRAVRTGIAESLAAGVTTVGDICKRVAHARPVLADGPSRIVSYGEIQAIGTTRALLAERLAIAADKHAESTTMSIGLSPHAPYTVDGLALREITALAEARRLPICMHLAELPEEREFLASLGGRIREPYELLGTTSILDQSIPLTPDGPIFWAKAHGLFDLTTPVVLAHVNYATDAELALLAASTTVSIAYCPRTRHYFGHDAPPHHTPHRYREMLAAGINVCLGTDSLASNPDLHLLREAQFLLRKDSVDAEVLLRMMTLNAAAALGVQGHLGSLTPHKSADMIALPYTPATANDRILTQLIEEAPLPSAVWIAGETVIPKAR